MLARHRFPADWDADIAPFPPDAKGVSTRVASGKIMNAIARRFPALTGGSADLDPSTFTALSGLGVFEADDIVAPDKQKSDNGDWNRRGRNVHFGVREHAMAAIMNGMAAHGGMVPYGATFLMFSEYMRPAIRLAALMGLHVVYVFTHDSIALGEDGPTHQPIEQLASLRAIPDLLVIRPADANETVSAWHVIAAAAERPVALVLTRQNVPTLDRGVFAAADGLRRGAYILADAAGAPARQLDVDRQRLRSVADRGGARTVVETEYRCAHRVDAELGIVRCATAGLSRQRPDTWQHSDGG